MHPFHLLCIFIGILICGLAVGTSVSTFWGWIIVGGGIILLALLDAGIDLWILQK